MAAPGEVMATAPVDERERVLDILRRHEQALRARGLTRIMIFGSMARGDLASGSDVDLLIEVDPASRFGLFAFLDLKNDLADLLGRRVDLAFADAMRPRLRAAGCGLRSCGMPSRCSDGGAARSADHPRTDARSHPGHRAGNGGPELRGIRRRSPVASSGGALHRGRLGSITPAASRPEGAPPRYLTAEGCEHRQRAPAGLRRRERCYHLARRHGRHPALKAALVSLLRELDAGNRR